MENKKRPPSIEGEPFECCNSLILKRLSAYFSGAGTRGGDGVRFKNGIYGRSCLYGGFSGIVFEGFAF